MRWILEACPINSLVNFLVSANRGKTTAEKRKKEEGKMRLKLAACASVLLVMAMVPMAFSGQKYIHPWFLYGKAAFVTEGKAPNPWAIELTSRAETYEYHGYTYSYSFSGLAFNPPNGKLFFKDIWQLSFDYFIKEGNNFGGSPRFTLFMWNDIKSGWDVIYIYLGTPVFNPLLTNQWVSTGNFVGDTEPRFQIGWLGWYMTDYAGALALAGEKTVNYVYLDCDGGWGLDQVMLVDNIAVGNFVLSARAPGQFG
jgi:hypothetical protein